jgi:2'-hydroxyisoflavone reductase
MNNPRPASNASLSLQQPTVGPGDPAELRVRMADRLTGIGRLGQDDVVIRLLILGGSWFLGPAVADAAVGRGWQVTTFRRRRSGTDAPGVTVVRGDRTSATDLARLADAGPWDAVVDTSGYVPRDVLAVSRALEPVVERYVFVSTVSVYHGWPTEPLTEESPILNCPPHAGPDFGYDGDPGPSVYGFTKAGSEQAVLETFGADRSVVLRALLTLLWVVFHDR